MNPMAPIYARLVQRGLKEIEDVPDTVRAEVEALLHNIITAEQYEEVTGEAYEE